jgi:drug/metabolite transporter (DMT)-like permease
MRTHPDVFSNGLTAQSKAYLYTALVVALWSTVATAFKLALRELDYVRLLQLAAVTATISQLAIILAQNKFIVLTRQSRRDVGKSALLGLMNPLLYYLVLFKAYSLLPAQEAQPLNYMWPVVLSVLSVLFLGQKIKVRILVGLLISSAGVIVIAARGDFSSFVPENPAGTFLALFSTVIWASFWIANVRDSRDHAVKLCMTFLFGTVYITIVAHFTDAPLPSTPTAVILAIYIGLFEMGLTFLLWLKALSYSRDSASVARFIYLSPFLSLLFIRTVVGEVILPSSLIGLVLIIGGILIQSLNRNVSNH